MKDTLTHVLHKSISFKLKTVTSNHISLDAIVSRSKPELPVVSACSTLSLPWRFLEGFQAGCTLDSRSLGQAQAPLHPLTVSQIPNCPLQYVKDSPPSKKKECCSLVLCQNFTESLSVGDSVRCAVIPHTHTHKLQSLE